MSLCAEQLESQSLIDASAMLILLGVVVEGGVVSRDADVGRLGQLVGGERVDEQEGRELETVLVGAEHVLVVQEVCTEEEQQTLEVHDLRELSVVNQARAGIVICHFSF